MTVSLSGLDLSFLKRPGKVDRGRFKYDKDLDTVMTSAQYGHRHRKPSKRATAVACPTFVPDVDAIYGGEWKSIVDGSTISSRSNWREHNKRNGVVDVGDKFWSADGDDAARTRGIMGYDPSLINKKDDGDGISFSWNPART
jgi:hypothetical protein